MTLHILLDIQSENKLKAAYLDQLLFQIQVCKSIELGDGFMSFEDFNYFEIEIGNTYQNFLRSELSMLRVMDSKKYWKEVHVEIDQISEQDFELDLLLNHTAYKKVYNK